MYVLSVMTINWEWTTLDIHNVIYHSEDNDQSFKYLTKIMITKAFAQFMYHYFYYGRNSFLHEWKYRISDDESKWNYDQKVAFILETEWYFKWKSGVLTVVIHWYKYIYRIYDCISCKDLVIKDE